MKFIIFLPSLLLFMHTR